MSKKILAVLTVIFILTLSLSAAVSADDVVYVSVDLLNIRSSASTSSSVLGQAQHGDSLTVLGHSGEWLKVYYWGVTGFVRGDMVSCSKPGAASASASSSETVYVAVDLLNIRSSASTSSGVLGQAKFKDSLSVVGREGEWLKVYYWGVTGFVRSDMVSCSVPAGVASSSSNECVYVTVDSLNIRSSASLAGEVLGQAKFQDSLTVVGKEGAWLKIYYWGVTGFVRGDMVSCSKPTALSSTASASKECVYVTVDLLNIRSSASTSSSVLGQASYRDELTVVGREGEWLKIYYWGVTGFVRGDMVSCTKPTAAQASVFTSAETADALPVDYSGKGGSVVEYAKNFLGVPYVYGGSTPSGFDCSGFIKYVFAHFGVNLPRTSYAQMNVGTAVTREQLQPGDLVVFRSGGHVGIYVGNNKYIHAPQTGRTVSIDNMNRTLYCARRIIN